MAADSFGNALGNSIVGQIEETNGEQLAAQLEQGIQPIQQANEDQVNQQFADGTQQDSDQISAQFEGRESLNAEAAGAEQDLLANTQAGFSPLPVSSLATVAINIAPAAGTDTGGGNTAILASSATETALTINAVNGQSIFTGQSFQVANSGQNYSDASYTNGNAVAASPGTQGGAPYEFISPADQEEQQLIGNTLQLDGHIALNTSPVAPSSSQGYFASVGEAAETESAAYAGSGNLFGAAIPGAPALQSNLLAQGVQVANPSLNGNFSDDYSSLLVAAYSQPLLNASLIPTTVGGAALAGASFLFPEALSGEGATELPLGIPINGATRSVPLGLDSSQFAAAANDLSAALNGSGITDATIGVRGSSVTGFSARTGQAFGPQSDIDFFVESEQLTDGYTTSTNIPGFVHPNKILSDYPLLQDFSDTYSAVLGREVTPGGFAPGTVPNEPAIIIRK